MRPEWKTAAIGFALLTPALLLALHVAANSKRPPVALLPPTEPTMNNMKAFLLMIQYAEGTNGPNAYRTLFGGGLFSDFRQHPNRPISRWGLTSTAAGAYQFLYRTWMELQQRLTLPDFSPQSQDKAAIELIRQKGALPDVQAGRIAVAIQKCRKIWASFPGAGYGQGERSMQAMMQAYRQFGGLITA